MLCTNIQVEHSTGSFNVFGPAGFVEISGDEANRGTFGGQGAGWVWIYGEKGKVGTTERLLVAATASKFVIQRLLNTSNAPLVYRVYLRESTGTLQLSHHAGGASSSFPQGQYIDAEFNSDGTFSMYRGPSTFDEKDPPAGSGSLLTTVDAERAARGLP